MDKDSLIYQATDLIQRACCTYGILASPDKQDNYRRLWARDSVIAGIAGLLANDKTILEGFRKSLLTLARHQHRWGMIPSNLLIAEPSPVISYGGLAGRVDATCWFILGSCLYLCNESDPSLKTRLKPHIEMALRILNRWEYNAGGLIYTPLSGNWADEYPIQGHTLYDNLLRVWGLKLYAQLYNDPAILQQSEKIEKKIRLNWWPDKEFIDDDQVYHKRAFARMADKSISFYPAAVGPQGYLDKFDTAAQGLALLLNLGTQKQHDRILKYINSIFKEIGKSLLPAFWPVIDRDDSLWNLLEQNYSYNFKNEPYHFHNGGIWPVWMGLFGLGLNHIGKPELSLEMLESWMELENPKSLSFCEYITSDSYELSGKSNLVFSASGLLFLNYAAEKKENLNRKLQLNQ